MKEANIWLECGMQGMSLPVTELFSARNNNQIQVTSCRPLSSSSAFSYLPFCIIDDSAMRTRLCWNPGEMSVRK